MLNNYFTKQRKTVLSFLLFGFIVNGLVLTPFNYFYLRETLSSIYLLLVPGFLLSWIIYPRFRNIWELLTYSLGISITSLMLIGLIINWVLPFLHITHPLSQIPFLMALNVVLAGLATSIYAMNKPLPVDKPVFHFSPKNILVGLVPVIFPFLSIFGAIQLNNNQSNIFTMIMLGLIATYVLLLTVVRNKISEPIYPLAAVMTGLSLLFMTSLRGWYITGHDIYLEYYVFQLTKLHGIWSMANFHDPYTACLSITILPTVISAITHISDMYIYKVLYQIIFAFSTAVTYLFLKKFIKPFLAFLGTFIIISLPTFMTDMPMLNRQEIALLFFALLLYTLFNKDISTRVKWILFLLLGTGLTLSHYSTTYVTLGMFLGTSILYLLFTFLRALPKIKVIIDHVDNKLGIEHNRPNLKLPMIIILLLVTVTWNFGITHTADGIVMTLNNITKDFATKQFTKGKSDSASYSLLNVKKPTATQLLNSYVSQASSYARKFNTDSAFLNKSIYSRYPVTSTSQTKLPLTDIGKVLTKFHVNVFTLNDVLKQFYTKVIQIFIIVGFLSIFWYKKYIKNLKKEHILLVSVSFMLLVIQVVLPGSSIDYGILRLFQQSLILLVIPLLIGALSLFSIFNKIHPSIKIYLTSIIFIFFFLFLSGFIPAVTGGYYPSLNLANSGFYYDAYYTHEEELASINWLTQNRDRKIPIQSDWFAGKKIHTYGGTYAVDGLLPSTIRRNSYVYLSYADLQTDKIMVYVNGSPIYYTFPLPFLDQNKDLIYSNGKTKIYR